MVQFAGLLEALPRNFAYGLSALIDQQGGVPDSPAEESEAAADTAAEEPADAPEAAAPAPADTEAPAEEAPSEEPAAEADTTNRSEEHKSELQSLMRNSYDVLRLKKK